MALCMITFYGPQTAQMNEELPRELSSDSTPTQHLHDEKSWTTKGAPLSQSRTPPPQAWYYQKKKFNSPTLVILLQIDVAFNDEPKIIYNFFYEIKDTLIFAWSSILDVEHYCWLCSPICRLPLNKVYYLVHSFRHTLYLL